MLRVKNAGMLPSSDIQYSGAQAIIKSTEKAARKTAKTKVGEDQFAYRWQQVTRFVKVLFSTSRPPVTFTPAPPYLSHVNNLDVVIQELKYVSRRNKHPTLVYRDQFIQALTTKVENLTDSMANCLFSSFDTASKNSVHYALIATIVLVVSKPDQLPLDCLRECWRLYRAHKGEYMGMDNAAAILMLPCCSHGEAAEMESIMRDEFRPSCYRIVAGAEKKPQIEKREKGGILKPATTTFNLCNGILDEELWMQSLENSPRTVNLWDQMRKDRLRGSHARTASKQAEKKSVSERVKEINKLSVVTH
jgi:transposase